MSIIAHGYNTASKARSQWVKGTPEHCEDIQDPSKDFVCGLGANLMGWNNTRSLPTAMAESLATRLQERIPILESVRILKTGSDACSAAVRIARSYKENQLKENNHENLQKMSQRERLKYVPQRQIQKGWLQEFMQRMCQNILFVTGSYGEKAFSAAKIFQNEKRTSDRTEALSKTLEEGEGSWERQSIPSSKEGFKKAALQNLRELGIASTPPGLQSPNESDLVMQSAPLLSTFYGIGTGYHGFGNGFIADEFPGAGCVSEGYQKFENFEQIINHLNNFGENVCYCIIEPLELDLGAKRQVREIRRLCDQYGIILIFDEIITGFRVPKFTVSQMWEIEPDLICLGKALGNGFPISIIGGRKEIMETPGYFVSGTFFEDQRAIQEALRTIDMIGMVELDRLWHEGANFQRCFNIMDPECQLVGYPTRAVWQGKNVYKFQQLMNRQGWLLGKAWFLNIMHSPDILESFLADARDAVQKIAGGYELEGPEPQPIFKR